MAGAQPIDRRHGPQIQYIRRVVRDPRFQALVGRLKLPDDWKEFGPPDDCDFKSDKLTCH